MKKQSRPALVVNNNQPTEPTKTTRDDKQWFLDHLHRSPYQGNKRLLIQNIYFLSHDEKYHGTAWASAKHHAESLGVHYRTLMKILKELKEDGVIDVKGRGHKGQRLYSVNMESLILSAGREITKFSSSRWEHLQAGQNERAEENAIKLLVDRHHQHCQGNHYDGKCEFESKLKDLLRSHCSDTQPQAAKMSTETSEIGAQLLCPHGHNNLCPLCAPVVPAWSHDMCPHGQTIKVYESPKVSKYYQTAPLDNDITSASPGIEKNQNQENHTNSSQDLPVPSISGADEDAKPISPLPTGAGSDRSNLPDLLTALVLPSIGATVLQDGQLSSMAVSSCNPDTPIRGKAPSVSIEPPEPTPGTPEYFRLKMLAALEGKLTNTSSLSMR